MQRAPFRVYFPAADCADSRRGEPRELESGRWFAAQVRRLALKRSLLPRRIQARTLLLFLLLAILILTGLDSSLGEESAQRAFAAGAALRSGDVAVAVDDHVNRVHGGLIHGGEIGVVG